MNAAVVAALVAAGASLVVAGMTAWTGSRTARRVDALAEQRAERDARREYKYKALIRLYEQCEPLLFQAGEAAATARERVLSLARSARDEDIWADGSGWLDHDGYYFRSTVYYLLAPAALFTLLRAKVTAVDLRLDPRLQSQYELLRAAFLAFADDFVLAGLPPSPFPGRGVLRP